MNRNIFTILVVEDDAAINDVVCSTLKGEGYECVSAYSGTEARLLLQTQEPLPCPFDLVICDLMLPGMSGEEVVALIREQSIVPILVTSAKAEVMDRVSLLRQGVDDYLVKPFDLDELVARVEALLRRSGYMRTNQKQVITQENLSEGSNGGRFHRGSTPYADVTSQVDGMPQNNLASSKMGNSASDNAGNNANDSADESGSLLFRKWCLNEERRELLAAGAPVKLTRTEFDLVATLMRHPRKVFTKRELYEAVWREESFVEEKAINTHISNIRSKLKGTGTESYIETVWGIGFKLADIPTEKEDK